MRIVFALAIATALIPLRASNAADGILVDGSEIRITRDYIVPGSLEKPSPQGIVDDNPPWFHVVVPILSGKESTRKEREEKLTSTKWKRRIHFRLSQDPNFVNEVIQSDPRRWSFWNPLKVLKTGIWYWQFGIAAPSSIDKPVWNEQVFSFEIRGGEHVVQNQPPSADEVLARVKATQGPIIGLPQNQIGKVLPTEKWPELAKAMQNLYQKTLENDREMTDFDFSVPINTFPVRLHRSPTRAYFAVAARGSRWVKFERHTAALLQGYMVTGDKEFLERGIRRATQLEQGRKSVIWRFYDEPGASEKEKDKNSRLTLTTRVRDNSIHEVIWRYYRNENEKSAPISDSLELKFEVRLRDIAIYDSVASFFVDSFWPHIPEGNREMFLDVVREKIMDAGGKGLKADWQSNGPKMHENLEHVHYDQHDWQFKVKDLLNGTITLARHDPAFEDWFKYAYELWLYRSPAMSRDDGACREGIGYFGVHDHHLTHTGWMLYKLTGYNYYRYKPWFANFGKYMTYANPAGNPGQSFSDGGNEGSDLQYFSEMLTHMCPENEWNLWRFKTIGRTDASSFASDMTKGEKAWDVLSIWREIQTPDVSAVKPPKQLAAVFRDIGQAIMHTDMATPANNLMVNFSSSPFGSSTHSHPAQNAFNVAYGGQPLFWRSGYYNGGTIHNVYSYKSSNSHNTIMPDFNMQGFDLGAYGWLPRFATGQRISYCLGDASHAYTGVHRYRKDVDELRDKLTAKHNGCNDVGVTRYRRHVAMLRPHHVIIYDELEAKSAIPWTFRLHCHQEMKLIENGFALGRNDHAYASVQLFCTAPIESDVTDQFYGPPTDEENKRGGVNPKMWHLNITTNQQKATRLLSVIDIRPGKSAPSIQPRAKNLQNGKLVLQVGDYTVTAQLDPAQNSLLGVVSSDGKAVLSTGQASTEAKIGEQVRSAKLKGSTLLWENNGADEIFYEVIDEIPDVLKYGNIY